MSGRISVQHRIGALPQRVDSALRMLRLLAVIIVAVWATSSLALESFDRAWGREVGPVKHVSADRFDERSSRANR